MKYSEYSSPNIEKIVEAISSNKNLSDSYKDALIRISVALDTFPYQIDITKLIDRYSKININEFPVDEIRKGDKDIIPYLIKDAIDTLAHPEQTKCIKEGLGESICCLIYPHDHKLTEEYCVFQQLSRIVGIDTLLDSTFKNPNLLKQKLVDLNISLDNIQKFYDIMEVNYGK